MNRKDGLDLFFDMEKLKDWPVRSDYVWDRHSIDRGDNMSDIEQDSLEREERIEKGEEKPEIERPHFVEEEEEEDTDEFDDDDDDNGDEDEEEPTE